MKKIFYFLAFLVTTSNQTNAQCWAKVSAGGLHTLAIKIDGTLWAWGDNIAGQLGNGTTIASNIPVKIGTATNWQVISAGAEHSMAIKTDGTLWAWGRNSEAQLGDGTNNNSNIPIQIGTDNNWLIVSAGSEHNLALKTNGTLWAWGGNSQGQIGNGAPPNSVPTPLQIGTATDWQTISAGGLFSLASRTNGTLWAWGQNSNGQCGNGSTTNILLPTQIGVDNWMMVSAGATWSSGIKLNGTLWYFGFNFNNSTYGQFQVGTDNDWQKISFGAYHCLCIKNNNTLWSFGFDNTYGQQGIGPVGNSEDVAVQIGTANNWQLADGGLYHSSAIKSDGTLWMCGDNSSGQLGDGTNIQRNSPVQISCNITLPVTWLYIKVKLQNNTSLIEWATASESNSSHFEIEHSHNGVTYTKAGTVNAIGNSGSTTNYSFTHLSPVAGKNYYRIKQVDQDGKFSYSRIITLINNKEQNILVITPNPAQDIIQVNTNNARPGAIRIYNMQGKLLLQQQIAPGNQQQSIDVSKLPAGMYTVQLQISEILRTKSFIKQ
jgi:alpha-tubulin suppressor-like RCC1 family protein